MRQKKREETQLVIGMGEIGAPIYKILSDIYEVDAYDQKYVELRQDLYDIIHICFGHKEGEEKEFVRWVKEYQERFLKPTGLTVIHATVAVGVSKELGAVHSPVVGLHPRIEEGIRTFIKFFSGDRAGEVAEVFRRCGLRVYVADNSNSTELLKILDTTYYALCIEYTKNIKRLCRKYDVPFELWTIYNDSYNRGYDKLGYGDFHRPNLVPIMQKQGGHCTINNCGLLDDPFTKFVKDMNANVHDL